MGPRACVPRVSKRVSTRSSRMRFLLVGLIVCVAIASASDFDGTMGYSVEERLADGETERAERRVGLPEDEHGGWGNMEAAQRAFSGMYHEQVPEEQQESTPMMDEFEFSQEWSDAQNPMTRSVLAAAKEKASSKATTKTHKALSKAEHDQVWKSLMPPPSKAKKAATQVVTKDAKKFLSPSDRAAIWKRLHGPMAKVAKKAKQVVTTTKFEMKLPITKKEWPKKKSDIEASIAKKLQVPASEVTAHKDEVQPIEASSVWSDLMGVNDVKLGVGKAAEQAKLVEGGPRRKKKGLSIDFSVKEKRNARNPAAAKADK